jgi:hypothetical protein
MSDYTHKKEQTPPDTVVASPFRIIYRSVTIDAVCQGKYKGPNTLVVGHLVPTESEIEKATVGARFILSLEQKTDPLPPRALSFPTPLSRSQDARFVARLASPTEKKFCSEH